MAHRKKRRGNIKQCARTRSFKERVYSFVSICLKDSYILIVDKSNKSLAVFNTTEESKSTENAIRAVHGGFIQLSASACKLRTK